MLEKNVMSLWQNINFGPNLSEKLTQNSAWTLVTKPKAVKLPKENVK